MDFTMMKEFMDRLTAWHMPGNSIVVYHKNEEVFRYSSGFADVENGIPMRGDELLNIYSCSKVTTVVAALQLFERGLYLLDDPLYEYIPEYRRMLVRNPDGTLTPSKTPVTIRHLFTMTSGIDYNCGRTGIREAYEATGGNMDTVTVARFIARDPLIFEPGAHWNYGLNHDILAALVEVLSGKRFCDYVRENIFEPLDMRDATYHATPEQKARMACQYRYSTDADSDDIVSMQIHANSGDGRWVNVGNDISHVFGPAYDSGGAGVVTSVPDYAKLGNALANHGLGKTGARILSDGTVDLLRANQLSPVQLNDFSWAQLRGYGYGLGVRTLIDRVAGGSNGSLGEFGWGGAAGATLLVDPDRKFSYFYAHHMLNPHEEYYQPRLRNVAYACLDR